MTPPPGQVSDVTIGDIRKHAKSVSALGERLKKAGDTGTGVDLGIETFGIIGQAFSVGVRSSISETGDAISGVSSTFGTAAGELGECATDYEKTDDDNSVTFEIGD